MARERGVSMTSRSKITARFTLPSNTAVTDAYEHEHNRDSALCESTAPALVVFEQRFDETNCKIMSIGLPSGIDPTKPEPGDYEYSGMHDHGPMQPPPKEGGDLGLLISLALEARIQSDLLLTTIIQEDKAKDSLKNKNKIAANELRSSVRQGTRHQKPQKGQPLSTNTLANTDKHQQAGQLLKKPKVAT